MNEEIRQTFDELEVLRNEYFKTDEFNGEIHKRVKKDKWSIAEVIYHCYLLMKFTRQASEVYLPVSRHLIKLNRFKVKEYNGYMENIYAGQTMKAPKILEPDMNERYSKGELRLMLEEETVKLKEAVRDLSDEEAYSIRYPDPVPDYPNVVQTVKLLLIHEKHHYQILMEREKNAG